MRFLNKNDHMNTQSLLRMRSSGDVWSGYPTYTMEEAAKPISYFRNLFNNKWTLLAWASVGAALGALVAWQQPYIYRSHAYVEVQGINDDLLNRRELDPNAKREDFSQGYVNTVARLLQSGPLLTRVAQELNQLPPASRANAGSSRWNPPITKKELEQDVRVVTHDTDRILDVTVESTNPTRAAAIANAVIHAFVQQDVETRWKASNSTSGWLQKEVNDLSANLKASEDRLENFTRKSNLLVAGDQDGVADSFARNMQAELSRAQADRVAKESFYEHLKDENGQSVLPVDSISDQYELQLSALKKQLAELEATYTPTFYKVRPLQAQIAQLEKALAAQRQKVISRAENEYRAAVRREELLRAQYSKQLERASDETSKMVHYSELKNQLDTDRALYALMMQKVKGYSVTSALQESVVRLVAPAEPSSVPARPNRILISAMTSFGFFCAGVFFALVRGGSARAIMEPGESQQYIRSPELGVIPTATKAARQVEHTRRLSGTVEASRFGDWHGTRRIETITWHSSSSLLAESFRSICASLLLPDADKHALRSLVITSLSPSEGKTTVACNMAIALAGIAGRVLLIDADRRRGRLHGVFGANNDNGLTDILGSEDLTTTDPTAFVAETEVPHLYFLPRGRTELRSDAYYSDRMTDLLDTLQRSFDLILFDTPPLLYLSDARVLGRLVDGIILVIRAGRVSSESVSAIERRLSSDGITIQGTVLNDWDPRSNGSGVYLYDKHVKSYFAK